MCKSSDLHIHTTFSDGSNTPIECINMAIENGVDTIAFTDHFSFSAIDNAKEYAKKMGITLIPGIELFVNHPLNFHILAYFEDDRYKNLECYVARLNNQNYVKGALNAIDSIKNNNIKLDYDKLKQDAFSFGLGAYGVFDAVCKQGLYNSPLEVELELFAPSKPCFIEETFTLAEVVRYVKQNGGVVYVAHPISYNLNFKSFEQVLPELIKIGIDGLEMYHCTADDDILNKIDYLCKKYNLKFSGGSDYHGIGRKNSQIGNYYNFKKIPQRFKIF